MKHDLTIVIPALNEEAYIGGLLNSLLDQDFLLNHKVKILVADAGSKDKTREIVNSFSKKLDIEIIKGGNPAFGRNAGAKCAQTKYVLFMDADNILHHPKILTKTFNKITKSGKKLIAVSILPHGKNPIHHVLAHTSNLIQMISRYFIKPYCPGIFMLWEKEKFMLLGGFDESLHYAEDYHLTRKLKRKEFGISKTFIKTSARRVQKIGYKKALVMFFKTAIKRADENFLRSDEAKEYWKEK
jgi:glycosyltransferase involved in cell wall biosynthesis